MENWKNLDRFITLGDENTKKSEQFAQQMVEFANTNNKIEIQKLLKQGATPNCIDDILTPLMVCIDNDFYELGLYLLKAGASISYRPKENDAFWHALKNKSERFLEIFVERRCKLERQYETNEIPLIYATKHSDVKGVEILLRHYKIQVNEKDGEGNTALHHNVNRASMTEDDIQIGKMLLAAGAGTNITNLEGKTAEEMAADYTAKSMIFAGELEHDLPVNDPVLENEESLQLDQDLGISKTPTGKIKI